MNLEDQERQEAERMAELRAMKADGVGFVSPLDHALRCGESRAMRRRWRAAMDALRDIAKAETAEEARAIAAKALANDRELAETGSSV